MTNTTKGCFISIEGIEGVGKSTNIKFIKGWLEKHNLKVICTREPGGTPLAEKIRDLLLDAKHSNMQTKTEILLMFASRAQHIAELIIPALKQGDCVITDRFTDASYAYQGYGREFSLKNIAWLEQFVANDLKPDITFFLDAPLEVGFARIKKRNSGLDRIEQEQRSFFERVREGYLTMASEDPTRYHIIDATGTLSQVQQAISQVLEDHFAETLI